MMATLEKQIMKVGKKIRGLQKDQRGTSGLDALYIQDRLDRAYAQKRELGAMLAAQQSYRGVG